MMMLGRPAWVLMGTIAFSVVAFGGCDESPSDEGRGARDQALLEGCKTAGDCEDGDPCTNNVCAANTCLPPVPVLGCDPGAGGEGGAAVVGGASTTGGSGGAQGGMTSTSGGAAADGGAAGSHAGSETMGEGGRGEAAGEGGLGAATGEGGQGEATGEGGANESGTANEGGREEWVMQGGSCAVATPRAGHGFVLMLLGLGMVIARRRRRIVALLAAPASLVTVNAHAAGFAQDAYTAPVAPDDLMWTERAASDPGQLRPFARLTLGYTDDPLVVVDANDSERELRVVDDQFALYGAVGVGFAHRAHLAVLMPLYVQSSSFASAADQIEGAMAGDLGLDGRLTLLERDAPLELALAATLRLPTGDRDSYTSDGGVSAWPRALLSKQLSDAGSLLNLSVGPMFRPAGDERGVRTGTQLRFAAGALLALTPQVGVTAEAAGATVTSEPGKRNTPLEGALGGRLALSGVVLGSTIGTGLSQGVGAPDWRWLATVSVPGPVARDRASEPTRPSDADPDHDGIAGRLDECPSAAEDRDGFQDTDGCPDADNDADGVPDMRDRCALEREDPDGFEDADGCPDADNDADGLTDAADRCVSEAEDRDAWADDDGCPDPDNDADGILDAPDKCPNEPETKNGIDDDDGCPDLLRVEQGQIRTLEPIYFDYNKAKIQARSEPLLLEMANLIRTRPDLGVIAIEGHTDSKGSPKYNLKLSKDRAAAVRTYLIQAGVPEDRLLADGFGSERPLEDNKTEAGRSKNRRVEFHFAPPSSPAP